MKKRYAIIVFLLIASIILNSCGKTEDGGNETNGSPTGDESSLDADTNSSPGSMFDQFSLQTGVGNTGMRDV